MNEIKVTVVWASAIILIVLAVVGSVYLMSFGAKNLGVWMASKSVKGAVYSAEETRALAQRERSSAEWQWWNLCRRQIRAGIQTASCRPQ